MALLMEKTRPSTIHVPFVMNLRECVPGTLGAVKYAWKKMSNQM